MIKLIKETHFQVLKLLITKKGVGLVITLIVLQFINCLIKYFNKILASYFHRIGVA